MFTSVGEPVLAAVSDFCFQLTELIPDAEVRHV